ERALPSLRRAPNAAPSLFRVVLRIRGPSVRRRRTQPPSPPERIRSNAVQCCSIDARPGGKRSRLSEPPAAIVSAPPKSAVKRQLVLEMATRSDSRLPLAFVAHQLAERLKTKATEKRQCVIDSIQTSRIPATTFPRIRQTVSTAVRAISPCETRFPLQTAQGYARVSSKAQQPPRSPWFLLGSPC